MPKPKLQTIDDARAYYGAQHPLRCAIMGHKMSGGIVGGQIECFRCGAKFEWSQHVNPSLYEWFYLRPTAPIRQWLGIRKYRRWHKKFFTNA